MLILNQHEVERLLTMPTCIGIMRDTLAALARGEATLPLRTVFGIPDGAFAVMPSPAQRAAAPTAKSALAVFDWA